MQESSCKTNPRLGPGRSFSDSSEMLTTIGLTCLFTMAFPELFMKAPTINDLLPQLPQTRIVNHMHHITVQVTCLVAAGSQ